MTKKTYAQLAWGFLQVLTVMLAMTCAGPWASAKELTVFVSEGETVTFRRPIKRIFLAEKTIADIQVADEKTVFIFGQKPGRTTLIALDSNGREVANYSIVVTYNDRDLMRLIRKDVGDVPIELIRSANGAVLRGQVQTLEMAEKISGLVSQYTGGGTDIVNQLTITGSQQVHLKVRVAEVSRSAVRNLGINWDVVASSGSFAFGLVTGRQLAVPGAKIPVPGALSGKLKSSGSDINALVDALASDGLVKILAEPNLTAVSGQKATFLAGGEFPFPVPQPNNQPGIQFRQFGVSLEFTPKIISNNIISMVVRPEVSDISSQNGTIVNGTAIPAISSRRIETTVELGSGQSLVIGGLLQNRTLSSVQKYPLLGDLPILGALFRSTSFQRSESELIVIVTPYITRPIASTAELQLASDKFDTPSQTERVLLGKTEKLLNGIPIAGGLVVNSLRIRGNVGFMFD